MREPRLRQRERPDKERGCGYAAHSGDEQDEGHEPHQVLRREDLAEGEQHRDRGGRVRHEPLRGCRPARERHPDGRQSEWCSDRGRERDSLRSRAEKVL